MKIISRCENCGANLYTRAILEELIKEGKADLLCAIECPKCGHETQVLEKPYSQLKKKSK